MRGSELAEVLARHGINASPNRSAATGRKPATRFSTKVFDTGADLLVMGAYGHARVREFVLGGATREALKNMRVPVLFSH